MKYYYVFGKESGINNVPVRVRKRLRNAETICDEEDEKHEREHKRIQPRVFDDLGNRTLLGTSCEPRERLPAGKAFSIPCVSSSERAFHFVDQMPVGPTCKRFRARTEESN